MQLPTPLQPPGQSLSPRGGAPNGPPGACRVYGPHQPPRVPRQRREEDRTAAGSIGAACCGRGRGEGRAGWDMRWIGRAEGESHHQHVRHCGQISSSDRCSPVSPRSPSSRPKAGAAVPLTPPCSDYDEQRQWLGSDLDRGRTDPAASPIHTPNCTLSFG